MSAEELKAHLRKTRALYFGKFDHLLDNPGSGPTHLIHTEVAGLVKDSLDYLSRHQYHLICYCLMPNHVHKIISLPKKVLFRIMQSHKGYTGFQANKILGLSGQFWHRESFDHVVRNQESLMQKIGYVLNNPVKARLCKRWQEWPHVYLNADYNGLF